MPTEEFCCDDYCNLRSKTSLFNTGSLSGDRSIWRIGFEKAPGSREKRTPGRHLFSERRLGCFRSVFARIISLAFGPRVSQLYVGPYVNHYSAHFELRASPRAGADALIVSLVQLVKSLPKPARLVWNQAYRRDLNIGIQGGLKPRSYELILNPETLKSVSSVNARKLCVSMDPNCPLRRL